MCVCLAAGPSAPRRPTVWAAATVTHASVGARRPPAKAEGTVARPSAEGVTVARPSAQRVSSQRRAAAVAEVSDAELLRAAGSVDCRRYVHLHLYFCVCFVHRKCYWYKNNPLPSFSFCVCLFAQVVCPHVTLLSSTLRVTCACALFVGNARYID